MSEFIPTPPDAVSRKCRKADLELERRILAEYPIQRQLFLAFSVLADLAGFAGSAEIQGAQSIDYIVAKDRLEAARFLRFVYAHRAAAEALKVYISNHPNDVPTIDVSSAVHWPRKEDFQNATR